jgi:hypothetical protein
VAALKLQALLDSRVYPTQTDVAAALGLSRARITQIINLLKLPRPIIEFLADCRDPAILDHFTERRLRPLTRLANDKQKLDEFGRMLAEAREKGVLGQHSAALAEVAPCPAES